MGEHGVDGGPRDVDTADPIRAGSAAEESSRLSRRSILASAIQFIDEQGFEKLTMRRLGAACGVEAMALYRYVHGRGDLLTGVVDYVVEQLYTEQLAARREEDGWQDYLLRLAHGVRQIALDHPQVFPLVATVAPEAPWVRPPLRSLRWMESFLDTLIGYGFDDVAAVTAYRTYTTFLIGQLLQEVSTQGAELHPDEAILDEATNTEVDLSDYPNLQRLRPTLSEDHSAAEFEEMLEVVLDRLELLIARR